jgi:hypothetical protein
MSYKNEHLDHIFFRMKESLPSSGFFYYIIVVLKLAPLFLLSHTEGYTTPADPNCTLHTYFKYLSMTFYIENSINISNAVTLAGVFFLFNLGMIGLMVYYLLKAKKVQQIDENYGSQNSLDLLFLIFSNVAFFKYVLLCQFFYEMNFLPLVCLNSSVDIKKVQSIFSSDITQATFDNVCTSTNFAIFIFLSFLNIIIDTGFNYILNSRFFDFNILSTHFWNTYPNFLLSFLFLESFSQVFFILFLNYENTTYKLLFSIYVYLLVFIHIIRFLIKKDFFTLNNLPTRKLTDVTLTMVFLAQVLIQILYYVMNLGPSDTNIIYMLIFELIFGNLKYAIFHKKDHRLVEAIITTNLNKLNDKNIYQIFIYLITEFAIFSDVNYKFDDAKLDLFLENYVQHLKTCEDNHCPCKNYLRKIENSNNTLKTGYYTTVINFTHLGQEQNGAHDDYILNKFFNVLSANVSTSIKFTNNNVNINSITDSNKQKLIYNLRIRLINAVKKLIGSRIEHLFNGLDNQYSQNFSQETKHFIRINYFSLHLLCNKNYYKTFFQFHEFLSGYQKKYGKNYQYYMIYYFYLKKLGIKEYNDHINFLKSIKKDVSMFNMDFRKMLSMCVKFYEIEDKLLNNITDYLQFITYFEKDKIVFDSLLEKVKIFKTNYKNMTEYIRYFFKNEKVNNLFICSKIILFYKILQFSIPQSLHNKLLVNAQEDEGTKSYTETNYYIIASYIKGDFKIKFISHELLIILEYGEEELRGEDFHILMPDDMREVHKYLLINEIKNKNNHNIQYKEIFLVGKKRTSILFDLHFKILLDLKGEITVLCVFNVSKPKNDQKCCFVCMENSGEIIATNREFEEYLLLSMKVLDYIRIDPEKTVLQSLGPRIRAFFKEEENHNSEFYEKFDYEYYLQGLFGEEFEALRDKNELMYKKKHSRWEQLKEVIRKGRYYNKFIDIYVKMRAIRGQKYFFIKYYVKANLSVKTFEPYSTTLSLINQVKVSKREMVRLSSNKTEDQYQPSKPQTIKENPEPEAKPKHPSLDFLNESQSALSSAALMLKEKNSKRLFKTKQKNFKFAPKSRNIMILTVLLVSFSLCSIIYNIISLYFKFDLLQKTHDVMLLNLDVSILKNSLFYLTSGIISLAMIEDEIFPYRSLSDNFNPFENNTIYLVDSSIKKIADILYNINYLNNVYYNIKINEVLASIDNNFTFIFNNGLIYQKGNMGLSLSNNVVIYKEISTLQKNSFHFLNNFQSKNLDLHFRDFILFNKIYSIQEKLSTNNIISDDDSFLFYLIHNLYSDLDPFLDNVKKEYLNFQIDVVNSISLNLLVIRVFELLIVVFIILMEIFFVYLGYEKAKKKMKELKTKVRDNNVELTIKKIEEYIKFCNTFNIYSLYLIADFQVNPAMKDNEAFFMNNPGTINQLDKNPSIFNPNYTSDRLLNGKEFNMPQIGRKQSKRPANPLGNTVINQKFLAGELKGSLIGTTIRNTKISNSEIIPEELLNEVNDKKTKVGKGLAKLENMKKKKSKDAFFKKESKIPFSSHHVNDEYENHDVPNELHLSSGSLIGKKLISGHNLNFNTSGSKINNFGNEQGDLSLKNTQLSQNGQLEQLRQYGQLTHSQNIYNDTSPKNYSQAHIASSLLSYGNINPSDLSMYGLEVPNEKSDIENEITIKKNLILSNEEVLRRSREFDKNDNNHTNHINSVSPIRDFSSVRLIDNPSSKELKNIPPQTKTKFYEDEESLSSSRGDSNAKNKYSAKKFSSNKELQDARKKYDLGEGISLKSSGNLENKYSGQFVIKSVLRNATETNNHSLLKYNGIFLEKAPSSQRNNRPYQIEVRKSSSELDNPTSNNQNQASEVEDSNGQLLQHKDNDDPIHLLRRETSKKKIQWTDQNVKRFYSPEQGLGAESKLSNKLKKKKMMKKSDKLDIDQRNTDFDHKKPPNHLQTIVEDQSMMSPEVKYQNSDGPGAMSPLTREFTVINIEQDLNTPLVDSNLNTETPLPSQFNEPLLENEYSKLGSSNKLSLKPNNAKTKKESNSSQGTNANLVLKSDDMKNSLSPVNSRNSTFNQEAKVTVNEINQSIKPINPSILKNSNTNSDSVENLREFKKLNDGTIDKVRKNAEMTKHKGMKVEEIEERVEQIIHSNLSAKIILTVFGLGFLILYMIAGLSNLNSMSKLDSLQSSSLIYLEKVQSMNSLILKYKFNLITNSTKEDLQPQFEKVYENINNIVKVKQTSEFSTYSRTYQLEQWIDSKLACDYLSDPFSKLTMTTMDPDYEKKECVLIAEQMNKNGLVEAYTNILNTMQQLNTDMLDLQDLSEESILTKMYDSSFFNLVLDMDYTFRKYDLLLTNYIRDDFEDFNTNLLFNEQLFSYTSIILNIVFAGTSLVMIILPIKYIETMISWLLHKLRDSE